jgi:hypothetical protein
MKDAQATVEAFSLQTRTSRTSKHGIYSLLFIFLWVKFCPSYPATADKINADTDPQNCCVQNSVAEP